MLCSMALASFSGTHITPRGSKIRFLLGNSSHPIHIFCSSPPYQLASGVGVGFGYLPHWVYNIHAMGFHRDKLRESGHLREILLDISYDSHLQ